MKLAVGDKYESIIQKSDLVSRDLSWLKFNERVLDQSKKEHRSIFEKLKFLAITASNLDEFFMIRVGSLYNYLDYDKERIDYSGLREEPFKAKLMKDCQQFHAEQHHHFIENVLPRLGEEGISLVNTSRLTADEQEKVRQYFQKAIYPMLTPMVYDGYRTFPILMNKLLIFGVVTTSPGEKKDMRKLSFVQIPANIPRFFEIERDNMLLLIPIEEVIRENIVSLFRNVEIEAVSLFRITRNGDFTLEESEDMDANFLEEVKRKLMERKTGRVVRIEIEEGYSKWMLNSLLERWNLKSDSVFLVKRSSMIDFTGFWQIVGNKKFRDRLPQIPEPVKPLSYRDEGTADIFEILKEKDILLHHPYNNIDSILDLIEKAADDPDVMAIKMTIYRLAKESRITKALLKAAENGKHVSVLFEVKARFDEENNIREAKKLQKAGCFVIYGITHLKTHTKLLLIVRKDRNEITRFVHLGSGNYNEDTARLYTDIGLLTTNEVLANDVSEFFNVITGHSMPSQYQNLITAPRDMRNQLIEYIEQEAENARNGLPSGIFIKVNSLEDSEIIYALYRASQAGVIIKLVIRGICCLRPGRPGLSENIEVISIVGDFLEHSRIYHFHNNGQTRTYAGSADMMVRSFDKRLESLFKVESPLLEKQLMNILAFNLRDNFNSYVMQEDGTYLAKEPENGEEVFNVHKEFFNLDPDKVMQVRLID
ncbi:MAG TPA: polyphosphate kinase 1 [Algoriphagus sp.]|jgi:polyphosphate kinase|uniref:polyphosphate kinase 1 n=1 Tax=unclassified Algoriphagus TaxID=2641541 RepID=UPI000C4797B4|nr:MULTISPECIES: polyphosphate kinase 1 [unclassified Algoriphagus]MAL13494.1 polyphosphate kinase 1 [Algoriphagus sp.]MAN85892.1 polyphosphate kinase 1 [Algoriphagus sp.]HCB44956.1 polyphosphate kinase 1 [Algoriphagus sp.]HCD87196.1 polyphosphate kinase 1 [Algoriphagus sp.]HCH42963.1 polyphosphate kinase 1 [Algoriphagus sp.]|tara:strand:- start:4812 stop:6935 length:2124 start_codon:yes stop_codon:yes gene_type:complete